MTNTSKAKPTFEVIERDTQTGETTWAIKLGDRVIGQIVKDTCHCGDGYQADSYSVDVYLDTMIGDDCEEISEAFDCRNAWSRGAGMEARAALAAAKNVARKAVKDGLVKP
jgi:hypothetical protein